MNRNKYIYSILFLLVILPVGCKAPQLTESEKVVLPEKYTDKESDTLNIASYSWREFFPDPYIIQYIDMALSGNHSFLKTMEQISLSREQLRISRGMLLPELSLGINAGVDRFGDYTMDGVGNSTTNTPDLPKDKHIPEPYREFSIGLGFQWEADIWGKLNDKKKAAALRWMGSVEAMRYSKTMLISEIAMQYYNLIGLDRKYVVLEEEIAKTKDSYNLSNELMKEGEVSSLSVDQFLSRQLKLEEMLLETRQQIIEAEHSFALLLGRLPFEIKRTSFEEMSEYAFPSSVGIPAQLLQNRPDIRTAESELLASKLDVSSARKAFFPSIRLGGSLGFNAFNLSNLFTLPASLAYEFMSGITAPIFKQHEIRALWNSAKSRQRIALLDYQYAVLKSYQEVNDLIVASELMEKRKTIKSDESLVHHRSIEHSKELFKAGFVGYLDVLSADERYLDCELERIELSVSFCNIQVMMYRALGGGCF